MTTNVMAFASVVVFNTLITTHRERILHEENILPPYPIDQPPFSPSSDTEVEGEGVLENLLNMQETDSLSQYYTTEDVKLRGFTKLRSYESQQSKTSLFHMMYAFQLYRDVLQESKEKSNPNSRWNEEVTTIKSELESQSALKIEENIDITQFYRLWKENFDTKLSVLESANEFTMPDFYDYPRSLNFICRLIYEQDLDNLNSFEEMYSKVKPRAIKKLLRMWLYDHLAFFPPNGSNNNERFYRTLLNDCRNDHLMYLKYAYILVSPYYFKTENNVCGQHHFFPTLGTYNLPCVSTDTWLEVLKGFVEINRSKRGSIHAEAVNKLLDLLQNSGVYINRAKETRLLLLSPACIENKPELARILKRKKHDYYMHLADNKELLGWVKQLSDW